MKSRCNSCLCVLFAQTLQWERTCPSVDIAATNGCTAPSQTLLGCTCTYTLFDIMCSNLDLNNMCLPTHWTPDSPLGLPRNECHQAVAVVGVLASQLFHHFTRLHWIQANGA